MDSNNKKAVEARARRIARSLGYSVKKSRGNLSANNLGGFMVVDSARNYVVAGSNFDLSLAEVIEWLGREAQ